jgi:arylsulfatase A-like enzyme
MHEASIRIPLAVRYPPLLADGKPKTIPQQVLTIDMAPSLLELCGAKAPMGIHGRSWARLVREGDAEWRTSWFYHYNYEQQFPYTPNVRGVRTVDWKYNHYPHGDGQPDRHLAELYDLKNDPLETTNLAADPKFAGKLAELQAELAARLAETGLTAASDKMPLDEGIKSQLPDAKIR